MVFQGTIPFDKTRQKTVGFGLHGRDKGDDGNPRGLGWSGQVRSTNTARPERGCGPKPNGLRGFVSRREWCLGYRSSGDGAEHWLACRHWGQHHDMPTFGGCSFQTPLIRHLTAAPPSRVTARRLAVKRDHRVTPPAAISPVVANLRKRDKSVGRLCPPTSNPPPHHTNAIGCELPRRFSKRLGQQEGRPAASDRQRTLDETFGQ